MQLDFDAHNHIFKINGVIVPSITQVIKAAGLTDYSKVPPHILKASQDFGTAAHLATQLYDQGNLDETTLDPALRPYLDSWITFCKEYGFVSEIIEKPMGSELFKFAGIPDRIGKREGKAADVEIKTTFEMNESTAEQTAGQVILWKGKIDTKVERWGVLLTETGKPQVYRYKNASDFSVFLAALTICNTKKQRGIL